MPLSLRDLEHLLGVESGARPIFLFPAERRASSFLSNGEAEVGGSAEPADVVITRRRRSFAAPGARRGCPQAICCLAAWLVLILTGAVLCRPANIGEYKYVERDSDVR